MKFRMGVFKYTYEPCDLGHIAFIQAKKKKEKRDVKRKKHIGVNEIKSVGEARFGLWRQLI